MFGSLKLWILSFLGLGFPLLLNGQRDTAYVQHLPHQLVISSRLYFKDYRIDFQRSGRDELHFRNAGINAGMRVKYRHLGLSFSVPVISLFTPASGKSSHLGLSANFYQPAFFIRAGIRRFSGFSRISPGPDPFRKDMRMWHGTVRGFYVLNHKRYSFRSSFRFLERQRRSQGSILLSGLTGFQTLSAESPILPITDPASLPLDGYRSYKLGLGGGYTHTLVLKKWFFTVAVTAGSEFRFIRFLQSGELADRTQWRISPRLSTQGSIGYNGDRFFIALNGFYLPGRDFTDELNVRISDGQVNIVVGKRFE